MKRPLLYWQKTYLAALALFLGGLKVLMSIRWMAL